jgi:hypothetical protein
VILVVRIGPALGLRHIALEVFTRVYISSGAEMASTLATEYKPASLIA